MRLIDADALMKRLNKKQSGVANNRYTDGYNDAIMMFRSMVHGSPTVDAVLVVRCADCDKWMKEMRVGSVCPCEEWSRAEDGRLVYTAEHEFCLRGEPKGGDE